MTGAGFGGCAIALVQNDALETVKEAIARGIWTLIMRLIV